MGAAEASLASQTRGGPEQRGLAGGVPADKMTFESPSSPMQSVKLFSISEHRQAEGPLVLAGPSQGARDLSTTLLPVHEFHTGSCAAVIPVEKKTNPNPSSFRLLLWCTALLLVHSLPELPSGMC